MKLTRKEETQTTIKIDFCCERAEASSCISLRNGKITLRTFSYTQFADPNIDYCPFCGVKVNNNLEEITKKENIMISV